MTSNAATILRDIFSVQLKSRLDGKTDQFNRIFMSRVLMAASMLMSVDYFSDDVSCMTPEDSGHSTDFYESACWINGFYIFEEMRTRLQVSDVISFFQTSNKTGWGWVCIRLVSSIKIREVIWKVIRKPPL